MKKSIIVLIISLFIIIPSVKAIQLPEKTDHEKVKINLFWASWCSNCHNLIEYFKDSWVDYEEYVEFVTYRLDTNGKKTQDKNNYELANSIIEEFKIENGLQIPLVIIGDKFYNVGFNGENDATKIISKALEEYQNENYTDLVSKVIEEKDLNPNKKSFPDACKAAGITCTNPQGKKGLSDGAIIGIVFGVFVLFFAGLMIYSRKD